MSFLLKPSFHSSIAQALVDDVQLGKSNYYYFLGKVLPWGVSDAPPSSIGATQFDEVSIRNEIVAAEKIAASDATLVIKRTNWTSGNVYDMWDSTVNMIDKTFFVVTDEFNVYKCIDNAYGATSTSKPFGNSISIITTADGYKWKFMFTIPLVKRNKFESASYIPVQRSMSDSFYDDGSVGDVLIVSGGTGYTDNLRTTITPVGGSPSTPAVLVPIISEVDGHIVDVVIKNAGTDYDSAPTFIVASDNGSGAGLWHTEAVIKGFIQNGQLVRVTVEDPGIGYPVGGTTLIEVDGDGVGAKFSPVISDGVLVGIAIEDRGYGYTYMNLDVIGSGTGAELIAFIGNTDLESDQSLVESTAIDGGIHAIKLTANGTSYTSATVTVSGDGSGCVAAPVIVNGVITRIDISNPGTGYTSATVAITGNNLTNNPAATSAAAYPIMSPIGGHGRDAPRELFGETVCLYSVIRYSTASSSNISQDFRQYGLLKNPRKMYTNQALSELFATSTFTATLDTVAGLSKDAVLHNGTQEYRVIDFVGASGVILLPLNTTTLSTGNVLTNELGTLSYIVTALTSVPLLNKYTGEMLFVSADYSFAFNSNQSVTIKTYMKL